MIADSINVLSQDYITGFTVDFGPEFPTPKSGLLFVHDTLGFCFCGQDLNWRTISIPEVAPL